MTQVHISWSLDGADRCHLGLRVWVEVGGCSFIQLLLTPGFSNRLPSQHKAAMRLCVHSGLGGDAILQGHSQGKYQSTHTCTHTHRRNKQFSGTMWSNYVKEENVLLIGINLPSGLPTEGGLLRFRAALCHPLFFCQICSFHVYWGIKNGFIRGRLPINFLMPIALLDKKPEIILFSSPSGSNFWDGVSWYLCT